MHDNNVSDVHVWIDRIWKDVGSHSVFANIVLKVKKEKKKKLNHRSQGFSTDYDDDIAIFLSRHFFGC